MLQTITQNIIRDYIEPTPLPVPDAPTVNGPNGTEVSTSPVLISSNFAISNGDTHIQSRYQIATDNLFNTIVYDSFDTTDLLTHQVPITLNLNTVYYVRIRHKSTIGGSSAWSAAHQFETTATPPWALPTFVAVASNYANATSITINKPTGTQEGDVIVAIFGTPNAGMPLTPPDGTWVQHIDAWFWAGTCRMVVFTKMAGASEPASYNFTCNATAQVSAILATYTTTLPDGFSEIGSASEGGNAYNPTNVPSIAVDDTVLALHILVDRSTVIVSDNSRQCIYHIQW